VSVYDKPDAEDAAAFREACRRAAIETDRNYRARLIEAGLLVPAGERAAPGERERRAA